jgi:hypothetical protein
MKAVVGRQDGELRDKIRHGGVVLWMPGWLPPLLGTPRHQDPSRSRTEVLWLNPARRNAGLR